ncbi:A disintegrin and metalloproteinase with thrombospondin motifs 16 [Camelus dromedarius]|uniref:A disintegrin and metalloproteinase with thrombospondin motifs 16 n=1 Tax=Camelus dromedarius TaxID=9838 RepID=A0A5N4ED30_CAMDR|nr:A disintegrin and metalloproteinase with thrombospondin motifs 16 [Camelus dromedarius]
MHEACLLRRCHKHKKLQWLVSAWSQCTASCGGGAQTRSVRCLAGGRPASGCPMHQKPAASQACSTHFCPIAEKRGTRPVCLSRFLEEKMELEERAFCEDRFPWCSLVPQHGVCSHHFYSQQCCRTCSRSNL